MNILQIGTTDKRGGAALVSWKIKENLDDRGIKNSMFVADKLSNDGNVFAISRNKIRKYLSIFCGRDFYNTDWIIKTEQFKKADIIHFHNIHGRYFNLSTFKKICQSKPVVWTLHDEWAITPHCVYTLENEKIKNGFFVCPNNKMPERVFWYNKKCKERFKKNILSKSNFNIVTPSLWLKEKVKKSCLGNKDISLVYNGIDEKLFKRIDQTEARKKLNLPLDAKIVFSLTDGGATGPTWKGWEYTKKIIDSFKDNKNIIFLCAGNKTTEKQNNNIIYAGLIDNNKLNEYFSACDVFLNTSLADNFPLTILEAMSCGLPIVSFDTGGIKEAVTNEENGYIVEYKSTSDIISAINKILNLDKIKYGEISGNCIKKIEEKFTLDKMVEIYIELYKNLINKNEKNN